MNVKKRNGIQRSIKIYGLPEFGAVIFMLLFFYINQVTVFFMLFRCDNLLKTVLSKYLPYLLAKDGEQSNLQERLKN